MSRLRSALPALLVLSLLASCESGDEPSNLQKRATEKPSTPTRAEPTAEPTAEPGTDTRDEPGPDGAAGVAAQLTANPDAPTGSEKVSLALALPEGTTYVVQTVGNVQLPLLGTPIAFAREERMTLSDCVGEGAARQCNLHHEVSGFDAEGQAGGFLRNDEERVEGVTADVKIKGDGSQVGIPTFDGPEDKLASDDVIALSNAHFFQCIRFPGEAVAVGAKWRADCARRMSGVVAQREVLWEVADIKDGEDGDKLVELRYVGKYSEPDRKEGGVRRGTVQGALYFRASTGEPHVMRERLSVSVDPAKGLKTVTAVNYTFGKVKKAGKKEQLVLTNGEPFPEAVNRPRPADEKGDAKAP